MSKCYSNMYQLSCLGANYFEDSSIIIYRNFNGKQLGHKMLSIYTTDIESFRQCSLRRTRLRNATLRFEKNRIWDSRQILTIATLSWVPSFWIVVISNLFPFSQDSGKGLKVVIIEWSGEMIVFTEQPDREMFTFRACSLLLIIPKNNIGRDFFSSS